MPALKHASRKTLELHINIKPLLPPALHKLAIPLVEGFLQIPQTFSHRPKFLVGQGIVLSKIKNLFVTLEEKIDQTNDGLEGHEVVSDNKATRDRRYYSRAPSFLFRRLLKQRPRHRTDTLASTIGPSWIRPRKPCALSGGYGAFRGPQ